MTAVLAAASIYTAVTMLVFAGAVGYRPLPWPPGFWVVVILWPAALIGLFFAAIGVLLSLLIVEMEKRP